MILERQRQFGINETHQRWLRGNCFYPPGCEDLSHCAVSTALDGQIISDFQDAATQAASGLDSPPPDCDQVAFWLYCLARNLFASDRPELRSEILRDPESGGIVRDLLGSSVAYCSRLAAEGERVNKRDAPQQEPVRLVISKPSWMNLSRGFDAYAVEYDALAADIDPAPRKMGAYAGGVSEG